jgi:hypothetical protein
VAVSYYEEPTDLELVAMRNPLETAAALNIGLLLFAFSRLELSLERYLDRVAAQSLPRRQGPLARLANFVDSLPDEPLRADFRQWIAGALSLEDLRGAIATGRWMPDPRRDCLLLDASPERVKLQYRVSELAASLALVKELQTRLQELCATERAAA